MAGQRAPLDHTYLRQLAEAVLEADRVLLVGHGHGQSDLRELLKQHLKQHHPSAEERLEVALIDDTACSDAELLAVAKHYFGNTLNRRPVRAPGEQHREASQSR